MKRLAPALAAMSLLLAFQAPASAHIVYFKDGTAVRGTVTVKESIVSVKGLEAEMSFPLELVRAISFSDEPIVYEQQSANPTARDWLSWSTVTAGLLSAVAAVVVVSQSGR